VATKRTQMIPEWAAITALASRYALPGYRLTLLEIQKLAYFLQEAGQPLKLEFQKQRYGPYAETLHFVLQPIEGHFVRGYGDRRRDVSLQIYPEATQEAEVFLKSEDETHARFERVARLIEGYETPYGMELLASVHWIAVHENEQAKTNPDAAVAGVLEWNEHKSKTFTSKRIMAAWDRLKSECWF
jgi:hypothetical protein